MAFRSAILAGNPRLDLAAAGGPAVKMAPPPDDPDAVRRIQRALVSLGFPLPLSFPNGPANDPDGDYGRETFNAVMAFQRKNFPNNFLEWDGRVGKNTLARMDAQLPAGGGGPAAAPLTMSALAERDKAQAMVWAQAALAKLATARQILAMPAGISTRTTTTLDALEIHFHISTAPEPVSFIDNIVLTYRKVLQVLLNSTVFFVDDTTSAEAAKGTPAHVPFGSGRVNFTPSFRPRGADGSGFGPLCRAAMVLHEPVHIVDHPHASYVVNHVHETSPKYATQPAANQLHNAHSYASFGQHAFYGQDTRYGIDKPAQ